MAGNQVYESVVAAMSIVGKYQPNDPMYNIVNLDSREGMSVDIVHLTALSTHVALVLGEAQAAHKRLDAWRKRMKSQKFMAIKESYAQKLRRGKVTDKAIEHHVRIDEEYDASVCTVLQAEEQVMTLSNFMHMVIELVNALKKRLDATLVEQKYSGTQ
jgi:ATP-dependent protease HslVU (ClpYQ) ATPase subunit